jgi:cobalt-zinc-cadmium efflux system protein
MTTHPHHRQGPSGKRELALALLITVSVMLVEFFAGLLSGSLALLADAGHMLTDASALSLSLFAAWIIGRPATPEKTYGYYRTEILAALANGMALWSLVIWIYVRAVNRLASPPEILTTPMLLAAGLGLAANVASSRILLRAVTQNLNVRVARLHVLGDALGSLGVISAGLLIHLKGWRLADPLASMFIGLLIAVSSWAVVKQSLTVLLEASPAHLNVAQIIEAMQGVRGVEEVHDLHLWTITTGMEAMSGHILVERLADGPAILDALNRIASERFGITHTTFQLEPRHHACDADADHHTRA